MTAPAPSRSSLAQYLLPHWPDLPEHLFVTLRTMCREFAVEPDLGPVLHFTVAPLSWTLGDRHVLELRVADYPQPIADVLKVRPEGVQSDTALVVFDALRDDLVLPATMTYFLDRPAAPAGRPNVRDADPANPPKVWIDVRPHKPSYGWRAPSQLVVRSVIQWPDTPEAP